jgi:hypothetical protein
MSLRDIPRRANGAADTGKMPVVLTAGTAMLLGLRFQPSASVMQLMFSSSIIATRAEPVI